MRNYMFETHLHTAEVSPCSLVCARDVVRTYYCGEYDGIVVTDHMHRDVLSSFSGSHRQQMDQFLSGYRIACEEGQKRGLTALLGMELTFDNHPWDFLVYGIDEEFLYQNKGLTAMSMEDFKQLSDENDLTVIAAHPFRNGSPPPLWLIHGAEVYNGNPRHDSRNYLAERWANSHGFVTTAGSDFHEMGDMSTGVFISRAAITSQSFAQILRDPANVSHALEGQMLHMELAEAY